MLPLLRLPPLHHESGNEGAKTEKREREREKKWIKRKKKKEGRGWGPNNFLTKPPSSSPEICWQTMKEVGRSQRAWGPAKKPGGESAKGEDRWEGGREGGGRERKKHREIWRIDPSLHCHQEFISSWKGVKRGWKGQRWRMNTLPFTPSDPDDHLPVYLPTPPLHLHPSSPPVVFHPALCTSPPLLYLLSLLASPSPVLSFVFFLSHPLSLSSATTPTHHLSSTFLTFRTYYPLLLIHLQTLSLWSQNSAEAQFTRHEK